MWWQRNRTLIISIPVRPQPTIMWCMSTSTCTNTEHNTVFTFAAHLVASGKGHHSGIVSTLPGTIFSVWVHTYPSPYVGSAFLAYGQQLHLPMEISSLLISAPCSSFRNLFDDFPQILQIVWMAQQITPNAQKTILSHHLTIEE